MLKINNNSNANKKKDINNRSSHESMIVKLVTFNKNETRRNSTSQCVIGEHHIIDSLVIGLGENCQTGGELSDWGEFSVCDRRTTFT
jgi:hypothetical protein